MTDFSLSTQQEQWLFSPQQLEEIRIKILQERDSRPSNELPQLLADEEIATQYFCRQILIVFGQIPESKIMIKRRWRVPATSMIYFRRFYIYHSFLDYDPRLLLLACIFLSGKTEEHFIAIKDLLLISQKYNEADILNAEKVLLDGIKFDLKVHHPQNNIHALLADWKERKKNSSTFQDVESKKLLSNTVQKLTEKSEILLHLLLTTTASVTYRPITLAVYAILATASEPEKSEVVEYLKQKFGLQEWETMKVELLTLRHFGEVILEANFDSMPAFMKQLKQINRWNTITGI